MKRFLDFARRPESIRTRPDIRILLINGSHERKRIPDIYAIRSALPDMPNLVFWNTYTRKLRVVPQPSLEISSLKLVHLGHESLITLLRPFSHITTLHVHSAITFPFINHEFGGNGPNVDAFREVEWENAKTVCKRELANILPLSPLAIEYLILEPPFYYAAIIPLVFMSIRPSKITLQEIDIDHMSIFAPLFVEIRENVVQLALHPIDSEQTWGKL